MEELDGGIYNPHNRPTRKCKQCKEVFVVNHANRLYCIEKYGIKGFCKDHHNHPRMPSKEEFLQTMIKNLKDTIAVGPVEDHEEALWWVRWQLECKYDDYTPEYNIGGDFGNKIDFCVRQGKLAVGIEVKTTRSMMNNRDFVNNLLGQLEYAQSYFKKQQIVAVVGERNSKNWSKLSKLESMLTEKGIGFVFIQSVPENFVEDSE